MWIGHILEYKEKIQSSVVFIEAVEVSAGAVHVVMLKSLNKTKEIGIKDDRAPWRILVAK